jgi:hypothetical protein
MRPGLNPTEGRARTRRRRVWWQLNRNDEGSVLVGQNVVLVNNASGRDEPVGAQHKRAWPGPSHSQRTTRCASQMIMKWFPDGELPDLHRSSRSVKD